MKIFIVVYSFIGRTAGELGRSLRAKRVQLLHSNIYVLGSDKFIVELPVLS